MIFKRHYFKWNINELIALQREYELLELSVQEIANIHKRSVKSILCKLDQENFIRNWNEANGFKDYIDCSSELEYIRDYDDDKGEKEYDKEKYYEDESLSDISIETEEESEVNYKTQINNFDLATSIKQFLCNLFFMVKKFTNSSSNSSSNLSQM